MSANDIIHSLENLLVLHMKMLEVSKAKTDIIKNGDVEALKSITNEEHNHIRLINNFQRDLTSAAKLFLDGKGKNFVDATLSECIKHVDKEEQEILLELQTNLLEAAVNLKSQNDLNQQLLSQSLAFVQVTLDLLSPEIDSYNYERPDRSRSYDQEGRSLFDSNA